MPEISKSARMAAFHKFLLDNNVVKEDEDPEISQCLYDNTETVFEYAYGSETYRILTNAEADKYCRECILESVWAFNLDFLRGYLSISCTDAMCRSLVEIQERLCEDANDLLLALIEDVDWFVSDAILSDGRGHFIGMYDGEEYEINLKDGQSFYLYRVD